MSYSKHLPIWLVIVFAVLLSLPAVGLAYPHPVSGTPLLPPVRTNAPLASSQVSTVAFSLLGKSVTTLPLQEEFYVTRFSDSGIREVTANLRYPSTQGASGPLNIYVETGASVSESNIDSISREFEELIYPIIHDYFGEESDIDDNGQITLLITDLDADHISGYFDSRNQYSNKWMSSSNEREMIYINSRMLRYGLDVVLQAIAHEFTHLVQWNYNWNYSPDNIWFTEGMAMYGTYMVGRVSGQFKYWDFGSIHAFLRAYNSTCLVEWKQRYEDYGAAYAYMLYLSQNYSQGHLRRLFQDPRGNRLEALAEYLRGYDTTLDAVLADWAVANAFDLPGGRFGYSDISTGLDVAAFPPLAKGSFGLAHFGIRYWRIDDRDKGGLSIKLRAQPGLAARLVEKGIDGKWRVRELTENGNELHHEGDPKAQVTESILVVANTGDDTSVDIEISKATMPTTAMEATIIPDLLLPERYAVLIKASAGLDDPPTIEVSGMGRQDNLIIGQSWPQQGLYLTLPFDLKALGGSPVLLQVTGSINGQEITLRKTISPR